jgi:hypothetical protein
MRIDFRYTRHQVARGSKPDAQEQSTFYLFKNASTLRLTYQIQLLSFRAIESSSKLVIRVPRACRIDPALRAFQKEHSKAIRIEKV